MSKRLILVEVPSDVSESYVRARLSEETIRTADVTDVLNYNRSTPGDPWDKPYPAMYSEIMERLS